MPACGRFTCRAPPLVESNGVEATGHRREHASGTGGGPRAALGHLAGCAKSHELRHHRRNPRRPPAAGFAARLSNKLIAGRVRKGGARFLGFNALVLTTIGRKTGAERSVPVGWFPGPDGSRLIVASAAGATGNPAWYYNLAAHPDQVQIEVEGQHVPVTAEQLHGPERAQAWQQILTAAPRFAKYQQKTDRELPIIRLTPRSAPESA